MQFVGSVFLRGVPAPGYRSSNTGVLGNVGGDGTVWSSGISITDGLRLLFYTTDMASSATYNRDGGFQLRCLSE
ncbi:hypothetical protein [uncultured Rikenella sp.]|nr:hypothetical protein [uncultured Rikenella sp.]